jgi:1-acyl-sn-glycerol-3-phosphate acyltransferase
MRAGFIRATPENAHRALRSGATVVVFPGGDYDAYRPSTSANVIDFGNRQGYVETARRAGVPLVPVVSIGGQENLIYLTRGRTLAKMTGAKRFLRTDVLPITFGFPFGLSMLFPMNLPLPTKIVTEVLEPIDVDSMFKDSADIGEIDIRVRSDMQSALDQLAAQRRLPVIG